MWSFVIQLEIIRGGQWGSGETKMRLSSLAEIELSYCSDSAEDILSQRGDAETVRGRDSDPEERFPDERQQQEG